MANLVQAFVPSVKACFESYPGNNNLTAVCIYLELKVLFLLYLTNFEDYNAILSKISLMKEFIIDMLFFEIPVSGCTCFKTL